MSTLLRNLSLALRNLLRNRRRSLTTMLAMIVGAVAVLLFGGYSRDIHYGLQTGYVQGAGHLQIQRAGYFLHGTGNPVAYGIADYPKLIETVRADPVLAPMLAVVTPVLNLGGIAGNYAVGASRTVLARGVVVEDQNRMRRWNAYGFTAAPRRLALPGAKPDEAVIGTGVARVLQLCGPLAVANCPPMPAPTESATAAIDATIDAATPPDIAALTRAEPGSGRRAEDGAAGAGDATGAGAPRIEVLAASAGGAPNVASLSVVKAENQGIKELDDIFVLMHLPAAQRLVYGAGEPRATAIVVQLRRTAQIPAARARLQTLLAEGGGGQALEVQDYETLNPSYGQITGMFSAIFGFISLLIGSIVLFTVGNTMSMAVVERTVEIGTLRAMGLRRSGIRNLFIGEGLMLGIIGSVAGVAIALAFAAVLNRAGLTWFPPGQVEPAPLSFRVWGEPDMIAVTCVGLVVVAVLSAWWPARRAASLQIVEALRHA